jgi:YHS domain-containing protein
MTTLTEAMSQETKLDTDPVCGMTVDRVQAREHDLAIIFADREYIFCAPPCRSKFLHEPATFAVAGRDTP